MCGGLENVEKRHAKLHGVHVFLHEAQTDLHGVHVFLHEAQTDLHGVHVFLHEAPAICTGFMFVQMNALQFA